MQESIAQWGPGINLGNSLDALGGETAWNNPPTTRAMIHMYAQAGFSLLRIPISWGMHIGPAPEYIVDPLWMARVREIVSWALDAGLRVIINTHHENAWLRTELAALPDVLPKFCALWRQIAHAFATYDGHLIFQGLNEPRLEGGEAEWEGATADVRAAVNALNHAFVATVRKTGGLNATRWLCIPPAGAKPHPLALKDLILPRDERLILTVHSYVPARFVFARESGGSTPYFDKEAREEITRVFDVIGQYAALLRVPVMITEYGAVSKYLPDGVSRNDQERAAFVDFFLSQAHSRGIPCVLWDNNYFTSGDEWFGLFNRQTLSCNSPAVLQSILTAR